MGEANNNTAFLRFRKSVVDYLALVPGITDFLPNVTGLNLAFGSDADSAMLPRIRCHLTTHNPFVPDAPEVLDATVQIDFFSRDANATIQAAESVYYYIAATGIAGIVDSDIHITGAYPLTIMRLGEVAAPDIRDVFASTITVQFIWRGVYAP